MASNKAVDKFVIFSVLYMLLLLVNSIVELSFLRQFVNLFAVVFVGYFYFLYYDKLVLPSDLRLPFVIFYVGMFLNFFVNAKEMEYALYIKIFLEPFFVVFGYHAAAESRLNSYVARLNIGIYALFFIPLVAIIYAVLVGGYDFSSTDPLVFFANRNNAALYMVCLCALLSSLGGSRNVVVFLLIVVGFFFGTLGVLVSVLVSFIYINLRYKNIFYLLFFALVVTMIYSLSDSTIVSRIDNALLVLSYIFHVGFGGVADLTYNDLYMATGSTDLSLFFRLKHWDEILYHWSNSGLLNKIFGSGSGYSVYITTAGLVPHNDYLRLFFEFGLISFVGFVFVILSFVLKVGRVYKIIPFIVVVLYFSTENVLDNFLAMALFFFAIGYLLKLNDNSNFTNSTERSNVKTA